MGEEERVRYSRNAIAGFVFSLAAVACLLWERLTRTEPPGFLWPATVYPCLFFSGLAWIQCVESKVLIGAWLAMLALLLLLLSLLMLQGS